MPTLHRECYRTILLKIKNALLLAPKTQNREEGGKYIIIQKDWMREGKRWGWEGEFKNYCLTLHTGFLKTIEGTPSLSMMFRGMPKNLLCKEELFLI